MALGGTLPPAAGASTAHPAVSGLPGGGLGKSPLSLCLSFFICKKRGVRVAASQVVWGSGERFYLMKECLYKNECNLIYATVWTNLENMMLSDKVVPKDRILYSPMCGNFPEELIQRLNIDWWLPGVGRMEHNC